MAFSVISLVIGVVLFVGFCAVIVWLCRQVSGAKNSMGEAKERQHEMERDLNSEDHDH